MKKKLMFGSLLLCVLLAAPVLAEEKGAGAAASGGEDPWMAAAKPGAPHQELAAMVGNWDAVVKDWMASPSAPTESKGVCEMSMEMGGRFLVQKFHGTMMGQPYEGLGYTGYDNARKKYVSTWLDNMSTGIMLSTGAKDPATKKVTYIGSMWDPTSGAEIKMEQVLTVVDADHLTFEMYMPSPDGKKVKGMEILYTRKK
jgi:hypothetical protein